MSHPALDAFGDLDAAAADPHVAACAKCRRALAEQQQVRDLLAGLPDPGPVPPDVLEKIETTLRSLADDPRSATVVPLESARRTGRLGRRPLFAVAAAAVVLTAGGYALSQSMPGAGSDSSTTAGAALKESKAPQGVQDQGAAGVRTVESGTDYNPAALPSQVATVLAGERTDGLAAQDVPVAGPAGLQACLQALQAANSTPVLVDVATFEGEPAAILVLRAPDGSREVWVVSRSCRPGQDGTRYFTTLR